MADRSVSSDVPWWERAFGPHYREVYAHRDDAAAAEEVAALVPRLRQVGGLVCDVGCGHGRHLAALRAAGITACGLDYSTALLADAQRRAACVGRVVRADMRMPPVVGGWGAVLMLFTAFGYFSDDDNQLCLQAWADRIALGGWLVMDLPDPEYIIATLQPNSERYTPDGLRICEQRRLCGHRVAKTVTLYRHDEVLTSYTEDVRVYSIAELAAMAVAAGLQAEEHWPSVRGPDYHDHRVVWWLRKK